MRDIAICKASVLVIRGSDGVVRGFHNVCSHRGNTLVLDERGSCPGSVYCHFHNWVYSDTGTLIRVPDEENFFDLDKRDHGLTPVNTDIWEGFVFVHLDPEPAETLREFLGGVADQLDGCPFHEMPLTQTTGWRSTPTGRSGSTRRTSSITSRFSIAVSWATPSSRTTRNSAATWTSRSTTSTASGRASSSGARPRRRSRPTLFKFDGVLRSFTIPQMIGEMDFFTVFPNFVILLYQLGTTTSYLTYQFWPLAVDRTIWEIGVYFREPLTVREQLRQEYFKCTYRDTLQEDTAMHETLQAGLASGVKSHVILQDNELAIRHFHRVLESRLDAGRNA